MTNWRRWGEPLTPPAASCRGSSGRAGRARCLIARITFSASPCSAFRYFILPRPTPCSPEQVPPIRSARSTRRCAVGRDARHLLRLLGIDHQDQVEVAVAGVADQRRGQARWRARRPAFRGCRAPAARSARTRRWSSPARRAARRASRSRRRGAPATARRAPRASSPTRIRGRRARGRSPPPRGPARPPRSGWCRGTRRTASASRGSSSSRSD